MEITINDLIFTKPIGPRYSRKSHIIFENGYEVYVFQCSDMFPTSKDKYNVCIKRNGQHTDIPVLKWLGKDTVELLLNHYKNKV